MKTRPHPTPTPGETSASSPDGRFGRAFRRVVTFNRMEVVSLVHSVIYLGLLVSAFLLGGPQPETFVLGLSHGIIWIVMSLTAVAAVHFSVIDLRLAVAIALLGCIAPFFGSAEFIRQSRQRSRAEYGR